MVDTSKAGRSGPSTKVAVQFLLGVPIEVLSRTQREAVMKALVSHLPGDSDKVDAIGTEFWRPVLSLMIKLMGRPTFYEVCSISISYLIKFNLATGHELFAPGIHRTLSFDKTLKPPV
jgi:nucleolar pre-ribosomal-associated protein 2